MVYDSDATYCTEGELLREFSVQTSVLPSKAKQNKNNECQDEIPDNTSDMSEELFNNIDLKYYGLSCTPPVISASQPKPKNNGLITKTSKTESAFYRRKLRSSAKENPQLSTDLLSNSDQQYSTSCTPQVISASQTQAEKVAITSKIAKTESALHMQKFNSSAKENPVLSTDLFANSNQQYSTSATPQVISASQIQVKKVGKTSKIAKTESALHMQKFNSSAKKNPLLSTDLFSNSNQQFSTSATPQVISASQTKAKQVGITTKIAKTESALHMQKFNSSGKGNPLLSTDLFSNFDQQYSTICTPQVISASQNSKIAETESALYRRKLNRSAEEHQTQAEKVAITTKIAKTKSALHMQKFNSSGKGNPLLSTDLFSNFDKQYSTNCGPQVISASQNSKIAETESALYRRKLNRSAEEHPSFSTNLIPKSHLQTCNDIASSSGGMSVEKGPAKVNVHISQNNVTIKKSSNKIKSKEASSYFQKNKVPCISQRDQIVRPAVPQLSQITHEEIHRFTQDYNSPAPAVISGKSKKLELVQEKKNCVPPSFHETNNQSIIKNIDDSSDDEIACSQKTDIVKKKSYSLIGRCERKFSQYNRYRPRAMSMSSSIYPMEESCSEGSADIEITSEASIDVGHRITPRKKVVPKIDIDHPTPGATYTKYPYDVDPYFANYDYFMKEI